MTATPTLWVFSLTSRTAPVAVREGLAFDPDAALALLRRVAADQPGTEALVLSTCYRSEFYVVPPTGQGPEEFLALVVGAGRCPMGLPEARAGRQHSIAWCRASSGGDAFAHLAHVASGLDSAVLGDAQILGQLRRAVGTAATAGTLGRHLSRATTSAIRVARQARRQTSIAYGRPGVGPSVASAIATRRTAGAVLVLGAGDAAQAVGHALRRAGHRQLTFANRTFERAVALAGRCGGQPRRWEDLPVLLSEADVVVAATAAPLPVIGPWSFPADTRPLVIDVGVPRQVSPLADIEVVSLSSLQGEADRSLSLRQAAIPQVEALVAVEVEAWHQWVAQRPLEEQIKSLWLEADAFCQQVGADRSTRTSVRRALHVHTQSLRELQEVTQ